MVNVVIIEGNLGKDPNRYNVSDNTKATFSIATKHPKRDETMWNYVVCWGKTAEMVDEHLSKGDRVIVEGYLNKWKKDDGTDVTEIVANRVNFVKVKKWSDNDGKPSHKKSSGWDDDNEF